MTSTVAPVPRLRKPQRDPEKVAAASKAFALDTVSIHRTHAFLTIRSHTRENVKPMVLDIAVNFSISKQTNTTPLLKASLRREVRGAESDNGQQQQRALSVFLPREVILSVIRPTHWLRALFYE